MKKLIKRVLGGIGALLVLAILGVVTKFYGLSPKSRPAPNVTAPRTPEAIERGKYLVHHVAACAGCHSKVELEQPGEPVAEGMLGSGRDFGEIPGLGHMRAPNITPDKDHGIGGWTDGEVLRAMREGVDRNGRALFPQMPYQTYAKTLSDDDALAIIAYLRTLKPIASDFGRFELAFPVSMFIRGVPQPLETPPPAPPPASDKMARGKWLLTVCSCGDCHNSMDDHHNPIPGKAFAGGAKFPIPGKGDMYVPNITSDKATGIGAYSEEDLRRVFEEGKGKSGRYLYIMPWKYYGGMTKEDKDALITALRDIPAVSNIVPPSTIK